MHRNHIETSSDTRRIQLTRKMLVDVRNITEVLPPACPNTGAIVVTRRSVMHVEEAYADLVRELYGVEVTPADGTEGGSNV